VKTARCEAAFSLVSARGYCAAATLTSHGREPAMLYRLRRDLAVRRFNRDIAGILATPPMPVVEAPLTIISMVLPADVPMYVLSMKAFYRRIGRGKLVAIIDRDTPQASLDTLRRHFPGIAFEILEDIDTGPCQRGGTWERVLHILDRAAHEYVVQVDCDTLPTTEDLREVVECIDAGVAFTMADNHNRIRTLRETAEATKRMNSDYIGVVSERCFDRYPNCDELRYVRGSSGLAGFAPGAFPRSRLEEFHQIMEEMVGAKRWREWGTEQCASNFAVANSPGAVVLPFPAYASFCPNGPRAEAKFFHFIGSFRFDEGFFAARGREEIARLLKGARQSA
jgi:hypothetical protein